MKRAKKEKAPQMDSVPIELLAAAREKRVTIIHRLCCKIWDMETWPKDWYTAEYVPIQKSNYFQDFRKFQETLLRVFSIRFRNFD